MKTLYGAPVWEPTAEELAQIERRVRKERAEAAQGAFRFASHKLRTLFVGERAADKIRVDGCCEAHN